MYPCIHFQRTGSKAGYIQSTINLIKGNNGYISCKATFRLSTLVFTLLLLSKCATHITSTFHLSYSSLSFVEKGDCAPNEFQTSCNLSGQNSKQQNVPMLTATWRNHSGQGVPWSAYMALSEVCCSSIRCHPRINIKLSTWKWCPQTVQQAMGTW